jgi:hypothetical protein
VSVLGVWVFVGDRGRFPSAVFEQVDAARHWIRTNRLTGALTLYPLNQGVFDWAVANKYFEAKTDQEITPSFVQNFSSAYQKHHHFEDGHEGGRS